MKVEDKRINEIAKITQQLNVVEHFQNVLLAIKMYFEELYLLENNGEVDD